MNNSIFFQFWRYLIPHILIFAISQNIFAAEENSKGLILLTDSLEISETSVNTPQIHSVAGTKIIVVTEFAHPTADYSASSKYDACLGINAKNASMNKTVESGVEVTAEETIYQDCSKFIVIDPDRHVVTDSAHIFALDPFDLGEITRHATIGNIIKNFGVPRKIEIGKEFQLQFSRYIPVHYIYPGIKFTFGFESHWIPISGSTQDAYKPYKVLDKVQGISVTSPDINLRDGMHVGMKWDEVVEKLGKPHEDYAYYSSNSHTFRSNTIYYDLTKPFKDSVEFEFRVDEKNTVTEIVWPRYAPD